MMQTFNRPPVQAGKQKLQLLHRILKMNRKKKITCQTAQPLDI